MSLARRLVLAIWAGVLLCLTHGFAPYLALLAPVPLFVALHGATGRQAFYVGLLCGAFEAFIVAGILYAGVPVYIGLVLVYALMRLLFAMGWVVTGGGRGALAAVTPAALWAAVEWLDVRLPYAAPTILGNTQNHGVFLSLARVVGAVGLSFVLVWLATAGWLAWRRRRRAMPWRRALAPLFVAVMAVVVLRGIAAVSMPQRAGRMSVDVIQGGLPTWLYTRADTQRAWHAVPQAVYTTLTRRASPADLTIWPETAVWRYWGADRAYEALLRRLQRRHGGALLVGTPRRDAGGALLNSGVLLDGHGVQIADKRRLALLAEHRFTPGTTLPLVHVDGRPVGVVFCLETVVPTYARQLAAHGAQLLVVMAEGSRFGDTPVGRMHASYSVLRAVETGRAVVHAGQQGFSDLIGPDGRHLPGLPIFTAGIVSGTVPLMRGLTPYVRWGHWLPLIFFGLIALAAVARLRRY